MGILGIEESIIEAQLSCEQITNLVTTVNLLSDLSGISAPYQQQINALLNCINKEAKTALSATEKALNEMYGGDNEL